MGDSKPSDEEAANGTAVPQTKPPMELYEFQKRFYSKQYERYGSKSIKKLVESWELASSIHGLMSGFSLFILVQVPRFTSQNSAANADVCYTVFVYALTISLLSSDFAIAITYTLMSIGKAFELEPDSDSVLKTIRKGEAFYHIPNTTIYITNTALLLALITFLLGSIPSPHGWILASLCFALPFLVVYVMHHLTNPFREFLTGSMPKSHHQ